MVGSDPFSSVSRRQTLKCISSLGGLVTPATVSTARGGEESTSTQETATTIAELEGQVHLISARPDAGFHFPYFLYTPPLFTSEKRPLVVEPNNTGTTSDDFSLHRTEARELIDGGFIRWISDELRLPALVPVFPRPRHGNVNWEHGIHALDREALLIEDGPFKRVDKQLLRMVDHARATLGDHGLPVKDRIVLNGYSSSGHFVDRFTAIHPNRVLSVSAGGINGMAILPVSEAKGHTLNFHLGVADLEKVTGAPFDREAFVDVPQFIYMGAESENDTLGDIDAPGKDTWAPWLARKAADVYGKDMQDDRFPYCESVYQEIGAKAEFQLYNGAGHVINNEMERDVIEFHRQQLEGDYSDVSTLDVMADVLGVGTSEIVGATLLGSATIGGLGYYFRDQLREEDANEESGESEKNERSKENR